MPLVFLLWGAHRTLPSFLCAPLQSTKGYPDGEKQSRHGYFAFILQNSPFFTNISIINSLKIFVKNIIKFSSISLLGNSPKTCDNKDYISNPQRTTPTSQTP